MAGGVLRQVCIGTIALLAIGGAALTDPGTAWGDEISRPCADAYLQAQIEKKLGRWSAVRSQALACSSVCPAIMVRDCLPWVSEAVQAIPSIVIVVRLDGYERFDAEVEVDGSRVDRPDNKKALELDIGEHKIRVVLPGVAPVERTVVLNEGQKRKLVEIGIVHQTAPEPSPSSSRPIPTGAWVLGGVTVAGLTGFIVFKLMADSERNHLEETCSPQCRSSDIAAVDTRYRFSAASLALGAVAAGGTLAWYLVRPTHRLAGPGQRPDHGHEQSRFLGVTPTPGGFLGMASFRF